MEAEKALERLGGVGTAAQVVALSSRHRLRGALAAGAVVRLGRGRYALAQVSRHRRVAMEMSGDCVRYTALSLAGWTILRFSWEQVMRSPAYVRTVLAEVVLGLDAAA